eukprot:1448099-Rhodomonas_salina.2
MLLAVTDARGAQVRAVRPDQGDGLHPPRPGVQGTPLPVAHGIACRHVPACSMAQHHVLCSRLCHAEKEAGCDEIRPRSTRGGVPSTMCCWCHECTCSEACMHRHTVPTT